MGAEKGKTSGSVMVVGAGIAGMQASLDLANSGLQGLPGGQVADHRRDDVPAGQDLSDQRLCHVSDLTQTGRGRPAPEHRIDHEQRS